MNLHLTTSYLGRATIPPFSPIHSLTLSTQCGRVSHDYTVNKYTHEQDMIISINVTMVAIYKKNRLWIPMAA